MQKKVIKGQKIVLGKMNQADHQWALEYQYKEHQLDWDIDFMMVMLKNDHKISSKDVIFYQQSKSLCKSIVYEEGQDPCSFKKFTLNLNNLPKNTTKILCFAMIDKERKDLALDVPFHIKCIHLLTGQEIFEIEDSIDLSKHKSLMIGEIYLYQDLWKWNTILNKSEQTGIRWVEKLYDINWI